MQSVAPTSSMHACSKSRVGKRPVTEGCTVRMLHSVFQRMEARMAVEMEASEKARLRRLLRRLRDVHDELQEYSDTLQE